MLRAPAEKLDRLATLYAPDPATGGVVATDRPAQSVLASPPVFASGGDRLVSTADDYLRFARMLLGGGELGWGGGHGTWYFVDPAEDLISVMMIQLTSGGQTAIVADFQTAIYQAIVE